MRVTKNGISFKVSGKPGTCNGLENWILCSRWLTVPRGETVKKLNTHEVYRLAVSVHPLTQLEHSDTMTLGEIIWDMWTANNLLNINLGKQGFFSPSLKRAAGALMRMLYTAGLPSGDVGEVFKVDQTQKVQPWIISSVVDAASTFETVLANELPGLATYFVSQKGIYSTDDLISNADFHFTEEMLKDMPANARKDICAGGRCLAFELATASAFHMWRALETMIEKYYVALSGGKTLEDAKIERNWFAYIRALKDEGADSKITDFLDHIRREYRNPITHPTETLDNEEALGLFGAALSAIGQITKATIMRTKAAGTLPAPPKVAAPIAAPAKAAP